jgi:hypothetical protein
MQFSRVSRTAGGEHDLRRRTADASRKPGPGVSGTVVRDGLSSRDEMQPTVLQRLLLSRSMTVS